MMTKKRGTINWKIILPIVLVISILLITLVVAFTSEDKTVLQNELNQLESELANKGYSWLTDYNLTYPSVEVYRENDNNLLATFENITSENWYKVYLTNLGEGESYDVFDLRVLGQVEFDYIVDPTIPVVESFDLKVTLKPTGEIQINYREYEVTILVLIEMLNGNQLNWTELPASIGKSSWKNTTGENRVKWGLEFSNITEAQKNNVQKLVLNLTNAQNLTWDDVRKDGTTLIVKDRIYLENDDLASKYTLSLPNNRQVIASNLITNFISNGDGTYNISFDPTITIRDVSVNGVFNDVVAEVNFTHLNISANNPYDSLVFYMPFDENVSTTKTYDYTKYSNDGTIPAGVTWNSTGKYGGGYNINTSSTGITFADSASLDIYGNFTILAWVYVNGLDLSIDYLFSKGSPGSNGYHFGLYGTGGALILIAGTDSEASPNFMFNLTNWTHVGAVFNNNTREITWYSNGAGQLDPTALTTSPSNGGSGTIHRLNGTIDEVMVFNSSLNSSQVLQIYQNTSARFKASGTAMYNFTLTAGNNTLNISSELQNNMNTNLSLKLDFWNGTAGDPYITTNYQNLTSLTNHSFNITPNTVNVNLTYLHIADSNFFYTPLHLRDIYIEAFNTTAAVSDTTPPDINLTYPLNITYTINVQFLNYTVASDATFCMYYNSTSNATMTCGANLTMISSEGSQTWIVYANDTTGNQNTSSVTFVKDTQFPIFYNYTDTNSTLINQGYANFSVNINSTNGTAFIRINNTIKFLSNISSWFNATVNLTSAGTYQYNFTAYGNGTSNNQNISANRYYTVNSAPNNPVVTINSTDGSNKTLQDLNCYATISDPESNVLNVTVKWHNNSIEHLTIDYNNSYASGSLFNASLDDSNTTKNENWSCGLRLFDSSLYSSWVNTSINVTILNSVPSASLTSPPNNNITTNRTPTFSYSGSDDDNDALTYEINISCLYSGGGRCRAGDRYVTSIATTTYTPTSFLEYLKDNNYYYNWTIRASDGTSFSSWQTERNVSIQSDVSITLPVYEVLFGYLNITQSKNTTTRNPEPLVLRNTGNADLNVSINFTNLFSTVSNPSSNFQFKISNTSAYCFLSTGTTTSWTNSPSATTQAINRLNFTAGYQTGCNNATMDLLVTVPENEQGGTKSSIITFISSLGEPGFGAD